MLSLVQAQSNSVISPPISVQAQSNQANETQYVSSENDSLADENGFFNENIVGFDFTNTDSSNSASINLFQSPIVLDESGGGGGGLVYDGFSGFTAYSFFTNPTAIKYAYAGNDVFIGALSPTPLTAINQLINAINSFLGGTFATFNDNGTQYQIVVTAAPVSPSISQVLPFIVLGITFTTTGYVSNAIQLSASQQADYDEVSTEFNNGCYELTSVNVYANNLAQANKPFSITDGKANGRTNVKIQNPAILPYQAQFVNECVPIKYFPNPTSELTYTLNAGETVRLIVKYKKNLGCGTSDCFADSEILNEQMHQCDTKPLAEVTTKPLINTMTKPIENPLISIIKPSKPTIVYTKPTVDVKPPVIDVAKPILTTKPLFKPVLNDTSIVYPKPPMVSPRPIFEKPMPKPKPKPKPQVVYDEPIQEKPTYKKPTPCPIISVINKPTIQPYIAPKPIVLVPVIIKPTIINVVDTCRTRRNPRRTNMREYISRFQPNCSMEEVFDYFENSDYKEL
mgnify:CR=1 FL=1